MHPASCVLGKTDWLPHRSADKSDAAAAEEHRKPQPPKTRRPKTASAASFDFPAFFDARTLSRRPIAMRPWLFIRKALRDLRFSADDSRRSCRCPGGYGQRKFQAYHLADHIGTAARPGPAFFEPRLPHAACLHIAGICFRLNGHSGFNTHILSDDRRTFHSRAPCFGIYDSIRANAVSCALRMRKSAVNLCHKEPAYRRTVFRGEAPPSDRRGKRLLMAFPSCAFSFYSSRKEAEMRPLREQTGSPRKGFLGIRPRMKTTR